MAAREYSTWRAFLADLELIFANARQFNKAVHPVYKAAVEVHAKCLKFLEERDGAALEKAAREVMPVLRRCEKHHRAGGATEVSFLPECGSQILAWARRLACYWFVRGVASVALRETPAPVSRECSRVISVPHGGVFVC